MRADDLVDQRMQMASKMSMDDERDDAPLEILQTKEQRELASYDEENRAIHEISRAREQEFRARKPLVHQESDLMSEESNRDIDWDECDRMRNKIVVGPVKQPQYDHRHADEADDMKRSTRYERRRRHDSNFSAEETQSSGSSGDRRRTGVIEDIDDDEFFLRQRGVSQDNADISHYISSAIRDGHNRPYSGYSDEYYDKSHEDLHDGYRHEHDAAPEKSYRSHANGISRNYDTYDHRSDVDTPVAIQYFQDDEHTQFYDNDYYYNTGDGMRYGSESEHADDYHHISQPVVPKRRHRSTGRDSVEYNSNYEVPSSYALLLIIIQYI